MWSQEVNLSPQVIKLEQNVCAVNDLAVNACQPQENQKKYHFVMGKTPLYEERGPRGTGRATCLSPTTRSGLRLHRSVRKDSLGAELDFPCRTTV